MHVVNESVDSYNNLELPKKRKRNINDFRFKVNSTIFFFNNFFCAPHSLKWKLFSIFSTNKQSEKHIDIWTCKINVHFQKKKKNNKYGTCAATVILTSEKLYSPYGRQRHLSTILVKDSHIFKIAESVFLFKTSQF